MTGDFSQYTAQEMQFEKNEKILNLGLLFSPPSANILVVSAQGVQIVVNSKEVQRMAKCQFCDKGVTFGIQVSHSHRRSNRPWKPNVKRVKAVVNGSPRHVYVCTRCMRSGKVTRAI